MGPVSLSSLQGNGNFWGWRSLPFEKFPNLVAKEIPASSCVTSSSSAPSRAHPSLVLSCLLLTRWHTARGGQITPLALASLKGSTGRQRLSPTPEV